MRILLVLATSTGGVGTHVASLAREFAAAGHTVGVIGPSSTDEQFGFVAHRRIAFAPLELGTSLRPNDVATVRRLRLLITTFHADVVHAHGFRAGFTMLTAAAGIRRGDRPRTVVSWHNKAMGRGVRRLAERTVESYVAHRADLTLGASNDLVVRAQELGADRAVFAPVAAPEWPILEDVNNSLLRSQKIRELGLPRGSVLMLSVGRVAPQKNYGMLLDALELVAPKHPRLCVLIAGSADPTELSALRDRVRERELPVHFLGQRSDVRALNQAADIFVLTSLWEARALVLQEAMVAGKAIIATAVGGTPELLGDAGIQIPTGDATALADAIDTLLGNPSERARLGRAAALKALDLPREPEVAAAVENHYRSLLS
nr:glycosyltransferase family 4 protein [Brevibacterium daeguense]